MQFPKISVPTYLLDLLLVFYTATTLPYTKTYTKTQTGDWGIMNTFSFQTLARRLTRSGPRANAQRNWVPSPALARLHWAQRQAHATCKQAARAATSLHVRAFQP